MRPRPPGFFLREGNRRSAPAAVPATPTTATPVKTADAWLHYSDRAVMVTTAPDNLDILRALQQSQRNAIVATSDCVEVAPFLAGFDRASDMIWTNYAIPVAARATAAEVDAALAELRPLFAARGRRLRFEIIEALWPALGDQLLRAGLALQERIPLMMCTRADLVPEPPRHDVTLLDDHASDDTLREILLVRDRAFGGARADIPAVEIAALRRSLAAGTTRQAIIRAGGRVAGTGAIVHGGPVSELVGVATSKEHRGRGIARSISRHLAADHLDRGGAAVWLSAGSDEAVRVYERIGFRHLGPQVCYIENTNA